MQLQLGLSSPNRHHSPQRLDLFLRLRVRTLPCVASPFFLDACKCRFAGFFLGFLLHLPPMMTSRPKQYSSI